MAVLMLIFGMVGAAILALLLTGIAAVIAAVAAGTSVVLLVKDHLHRTLLLYGCGVLLSGGILCLLLYMAVEGTLTEMTLRWLAVGICGTAALLSIFGVRKARQLIGKGWRVVVTVLFVLGLVTAGILCVLAAILI